MRIAMRIRDPIHGTISVAARVDLPPDVSLRFRAAVRAAMLSHDLGHMPLSHASEKIAPPRAALQLPAWLAEAPRPPHREARALHEDYTAKIVLDSSLVGP